MKKRFIILSLLLFASGVHSAPTIYQAENGTLVGTNTSTTLAGYQGSGYVDGFDTAGDYCQVTVNVATAGMYTITLGYAATMGEKTNDLYANGVFQASVYFPATTGFSSVSAGMVPLNAGNNTLRVQNNWGWFYLDWFGVEAAVLPTLSVPTTLVDTSATAATRCLMNYLVSGYGTRIISGQQGTTTNMNWLNTNTGHYPALRGFDMMSYSPSRVAYGEPDPLEVEAAIAWYQTGGIVQFQWHWNAPSGLLNTTDHEWWRGFYTHATTFDVQYAMNNPTSQQYTDILRDIDAIAVQLKRLRDAGVPILWRPLHEAQGAWFWWGAKGSTACKQLYNLVFDRLTNYHGLHNLIWVWTTQDNTDSPNWYPGDSRVDIVGADIYLAGLNYAPSTGMFYNIVNMFGGRKLVAMTENGTIPDPALMTAQSARWAYFMTWSGFESDTAQNAVTHVNAVFDHAYVITREELSGVYACSTSPTPTFTRTPTFTVTRTNSPTITNTVTRTATVTVTRSPTPTITNTMTRTSTVTVTRSPTPSFTSTSTVTRTNTVTFTPTFTATFSSTRSPTPSQTSTPTATRTLTNTWTWTVTATVTRSPTPTYTATSTLTSSPTPTYSNTQTLSPTPSQTSTPTSTRTLTNTATGTITNTRTRTHTVTWTATPTPTSSFTPSFTVTFTSTRTNTDTNTPTRTATATFTRSPTPSFTATSTITRTNSATFSPTVTLTRTNTLTATHTWTGVPPTSTPTLSPTPTHTSTNTVTPSSTPSMTRSATASHTPTFTWTSTYTATASATFTPSPTFTGVQPTNTPTATYTNTFSPTPTFSSTSSMTATFTASLTTTRTPSPTASYTPSFTSTPTSTPSPTRTFTPTMTWTGVPPTSTYTFSPTVTLTRTNTPSATATSTATLTLTRTFTATLTSTSTSYLLTPTSSPTASLTPTFYLLTSTSTPSASPTSSSTATLTSSPTPHSSFLIPHSPPALYPNPCQGDCTESTLEVTVKQAGDTVRVQVFTTAFRKVNEVVWTDLPAGVNSLKLKMVDRNSGYLSNGVYYLRVFIGGETHLMKLLVLR